MRAGQLPIDDQMPHFRAALARNRTLTEAWRESGLGAPTGIDELNQRILTLEQHVVELRLQLEERDQDLGAARAANGELMDSLNTS